MTTIAISAVGQEANLGFIPRSDQNDSLMIPAARRQNYRSNLERNLIRIGLPSSPHGIGSGTKRNARVDSSTAHGLRFD